MANKLPKTALRLAGAFTIVLALFAAALAFTIRALDRLDAADSEVAALDEAKHAAHAVAALVREQYIHQAHTIIEWNDSHVDHYGEVARRVRVATRRLESLTREQRARELAEEITRLADRADTDFRQRILAMVGRDGRERAVPAHAQTERLVTRVVGLIEELSTLLERQSAEARSAQARLRSRVRVAVLSCFALALAAAAGIGFAITRSITRRLVGVREGAARLAEGDLAARIEVRGKDEFAELAHAFNRMAQALEAHQAERLQAQKLASIGQVAAGVAHEINNPLGVILGYTKLLARDSEPAKLLEGLQVIEDETRQCQRIVQGLLELARPPHTPSAKVDLVQIARDAIEHLGEAGKLEEMEVALPENEAPLWVVGDAAKLRQVVANLVQNAVEASSETHGRVAVAVDRHADQVELSVLDSGCGIPEGAQLHVFEPFFTTKARGTGLGLAISQAIAHAHGGEIVIHSESGDGTRAILRLPSFQRHWEQAAE